MKQLVRIVGSALVFGSLALAGSAGIGAGIGFGGIAAASTSSGGITPDPGPTVISSSAPAVAAPTISAGADADATAGPGGAGGLDRPVNSLSTQDSGGKAGATVNVTGMQSNGKASTDGSSTTQSELAEPQLKALSNANAVPSS